MVPKNAVTMLVAALLATICLVAGAPMFPGDSSDLFDRSVNGLRHAMGSLPTSSSVAGHQPEYDQHGFPSLPNAGRYARSVAGPEVYAMPHYYAGMHMWDNVPQSLQPDHLDAASGGMAIGSAHYDDLLDLDELLAPAHAYGNAHFEGLQDAHAPPHHHAGMHTWSYVPQSSQPDQLDASSRLPAMDSRQDLSSKDVDEMIDLIHDRDQDGPGPSHPVPPGHLRSTSMGLGQQQHLGAPTGVNPDVAGSLQSMSAQGSLLPVSSSSLHRQAGPSSLPGEPMAGKARGQSGPPTRIRPSSEQMKLRRSTKQRERYHAKQPREAQPAASIGTGLLAIARDDMYWQRAEELKTLNDRDLHALANSLFTTKLAGEQPVIQSEQRGKIVSLKGFVLADRDQALIVRETLMRRLDGSKHPDGPNDSLELATETTASQGKPNVGSLFENFDQARLAKLGPFEVPEPASGQHPHRPYFDDFVLGEYLIHVYKSGHASGRSVYAFPITSLKQRKSKWEKGDPMAIFLGWLTI